MFYLPYIVIITIYLIVAFFGVFGFFLCCKKDNRAFLYVGLSVAGLMISLLVDFLFEKYGLFG